MSTVNKNKKGEKKEEKMKSRKWQILNLPGSKSWYTFMDNLTTKEKAHLSRRLDKPFDSN